jgi:multidrug efflux pump subunit AcrA (membrane-fusion protein)
MYAGRRKLITWIVVGALAVALLGVAFIKRSEWAASPVPTAEQGEGAQRPKDTAPAQIEQTPRRREDVFVPPPSDVTGTATLPPPK